MALKTPAFNDAKTYGFEWLRLGNELPLQEGAMSSADLKVTAAAAGGMRVDIAAGIALVKGDSGIPQTGLSQGLYIAVNDATAANAVTLPAANGTNPRIDRIILRVGDTNDLGSASDTATFDFIQGTATSAATLDNLSGAAAIPNDALHLADVLVPAGSSATSAGNIRDRRKWARGAYVFAAGDASTTYNNTTTSDQTIGTLTKRVELSGAPLECIFTAQLANSNAAQPSVVRLKAGATEVANQVCNSAAGAGNQYLAALNGALASPDAGSTILTATFALWTGATGTVSVTNSGAGVPRIMWRENLRPQTSND